MGAIIGAIFAISITGVLLQLFFGIFLCVVAFVMAKPLTSFFSVDMPGPFGKTIVGTIIGFFASIFGIGGGSLSVPYFSWTKIPMKNAIATSAACGLPIAISAAIVYSLKGMGNQELPEYTVGFVYLPAFFGIVITSVFFAKVGAKLAYRLPSKALKAYFSLFLLAIGIYFIWANILFIFMDYNG